MRTAVLTDIHANKEALQAVLTDLQARSIDRIAILGDIVGYGPDPGWCVDRVAELVGQGAICIRGNHDNAIGDPGESMGNLARRAIEWTRPQLNDAQKAFLKSLPLIHTEPGLRLVHASANDPQDWIYVTSESRAMPSFRVCAEPMIFCGHVHVPLLVSSDMGGTARAHAFPMGQPFPLLRSRRWLAVVGSVGQPRDGSPMAAYALHDTARNELTFRRVSYDAARTAQKIHDAGLPPELAARLLIGE